MRHGRLAGLGHQVSLVSSAALVAGEARAITCNILVIDVVRLGPRSRSARSRIRVTSYHNHGVILLSIRSSVSLLLMTVPRLTGSAALHTLVFQMLLAAVTLVISDRQLLAVDSHARSQLLA